MDQYIGIYSFLLGVFGMVTSILGTVLFFRFHLDKKLDKNRKKTNEILKGD